MNKLCFNYYQYGTNVSSFCLFGNQPEMLFHFYKWSDIGKAFSEELQTSHRHDFFTIAWLRKGEYKQVIEDHTYDIQEDTIILGHPDQKTMCLDTSGIKDAVNLCINAKVMLNIGKSLSNFLINNLFYDTNIIHLTDPTIKKEIGQLFDSLEKECNKKEYTEIDNLIQTSIFVHIVLLLLRQNHNTCNKQSVMQKRGSLNQQRYIQFVKLVNNKFTTKHDVQYYANELAVSIRTLERCVKINSGKTPKQLIIERLVQAAKILINEKKYTLQATAVELGFNEYSHFKSYIKSAPTGPKTRQ